VAKSFIAETASERETMRERGGVDVSGRYARRKDARIFFRSAMAMMTGAFGWLAAESIAHAQPCAAPGTVTTECSPATDCAKLTVNNAQGSIGGQVAIPITFEQGPNDNQAGKGFDEVAALAFTLGVPGSGDSAPLTFDCSGGDLASGAVSLGAGLDDFAVVIENAQCANRNRCLCPDTGGGQTTDNFVNVVVYGPRNLPEQGPVQIPVLPASSTITLNMRIASNPPPPSSIPLHVFSALGAAKPQFAANLSIGDQAACDVTANSQNGRSNVLITDGVVTVSGTPPPVACVGDCDGDHMVVISELITGVNIALGNSPISTCTAFDPNHDGMVAINELVAAVGNALNGCS
jgi:hypothetical protein